MPWASEMKTEDIVSELSTLNLLIDKFEASDISGGGSPGESMYERHDELTRELEKRHLSAVADGRV